MWMGFFLIALLVTLATPFVIGFSISSMVGLLLGFMWLVPVYGYIWSKDLGFRRAWRVAFWLAAVYFLVAIPLAFAVLVSSPGVSWQWLLLLGMVIMSVANLYALYRYSRPLRESSDA